MEAQLGETEREREEEERPRPWWSMYDNAPLPAHRLGRSSRSTPSNHHILMCFSARPVVRPKPCTSPLARTCAKRLAMQACEQRLGGSKNELSRTSGGLEVSVR
jgi:hypothetical protein